VRLQAVGPGDVLLLARALADERLERLDRHLGGDLARVVPAHPVADRVEVDIRLDEEVVLVELPPAPDVRLPESLQRHLVSRHRGAAPEARVVNLV
jgi:hypothetical protein